MGLPPYTLDTLLYTILTMDGWLGHSTGVMFVATWCGIIRCEHVCNCSQEVLWWTWYHNCRSRRKKSQFMSRLGHTILLFSKKCGSHFQVLWSTCWSTESTQCGTMDWSCDSICSLWVHKCWALSTSLFQLPHPQPDSMDPFWHWRREGHNNLPQNKDSLQAFWLTSSGHVFRQGHWILSTLQSNIPFSFGLCSLHVLPCITVLLAVSSFLWLAAVRIEYRQKE